MRQQEAWNAEKGRVISNMNGLLKFITCGSVDDGKSTLIGHILYDSKLLYADQEKALELDSKVGSRGGAIDYSLLLDGLMAVIPSDVFRFNRYVVTLCCRQRNYLNVFKVRLNRAA